MLYQNFTPQKELHEKAIRILERQGQVYRRYYDRSSTLHNWKSLPLGDPNRFMFSEKNLMADVAHLEKLQMRLHGMYCRTISKLYNICYSYS